ncbi:MAG TPA: hypothetical protein VH619_15100 [Verrucomicrobiae bacterium]|jgi:hypothetical protein|nr:hypothetical protein [Verrucomicrobiae bacterium]
MTFKGHTHDEIVFRVLLQREQQRPQLTFKLLECSLPNKIRNQVETDWRGYIRAEELEFDSAFQKAVRKNIPGVYYVVMAAEYLYEIPFHTALAHFLDIQRSPGSFNEDKIFALAEFFAEHVRQHRAAQQALARARQQHPPQHPAAPGAKPAKPKGPVRRCAFCKDLIPVVGLFAHIDAHLNPAHLGTYNPVRLPKQKEPTPPQSQQDFRPVAVKSSRASHFRGGRCIMCNHVPIPGDFYCYEHAPD